MQIYAEITIYANTSLYFQRNIRLVLATKMEPNCTTQKDSNKEIRQDRLQQAVKTAL